LIPVRENLLYSMNPRGNVAGGDSGNLAYLCGVNTFEEQQHELPIEWPKLSYQAHQAISRKISLRRFFGIALWIRDVHLIKAQQLP